MFEKVLFSGSGGQGIQLGSRIFAQACVEENYFVSLIPSYGAEMRGGNTTCRIVVSDKEIASPLFDYATVSLILSKLALKSYKDSIKPPLKMVIDDSIEYNSLVPENIDIIKIQAIKLTDEKVKNMKLVNLVAIGAFIKSTGLVKFKSVEKAVNIIFKAKNEKLVTDNLKALEIGYNNGVI